jgi:hypothetical protein
MLNGRTVSVEMLIENLQQDYGFSDINKSEIIEWLWKSMEIIGSPYPYEDKPIEIDIVNHRGVLPVNLYSINAVREKTTAIPLREMTDLFNKFELPAYQEDLVVSSDVDPSTGVYYETVIYPDTTASEYYTYKVQNNYIYTGLKEGTLEMQYKAIPIDIITGMPVIPDSAIYIRGVVSFIAERLAFRMFMKDMLTQAKYELIRQDYLFNVGAAKNICTIPNASRMETLINLWRSTYLGPSHFDDGFMFLGSRE